MNATRTKSLNTPQAVGHASKDLARYFYSGAALLLFLLMFLGFQQFYVHGKAYPGRELTPPIRTLIILHGVAMSTWMLLFVAQPLLIASGNRRVHMTLGKVGAGLTVVVVFLGLRLGIESARVNPPDLLLWGLTPPQFMAVSVISITMFGTLVAVAIWKRRQPELHRPMMLLAVLAAMPAAMDRIDPIKSLYAETVFGTIWGPFFSTLVVGLFLVGLHWTLTRKLSRPLAIGYAGLVLMGAIIMRLAPSGLWESFTNFLL
tara:strand:- start:48 stop:827 length:780 start_codon:yes stop_codon:yes gene_type:complete